MLYKSGEIIARVSGHAEAPSGPESSSQSRMQSPQRIHAKVAHLRNDKSGSQASALNGRGVMELVIANVALSNGFIRQNLFHNPRSYGGRYHLRD